MNSSAQNPCWILGDYDWYYSWDSQWRSTWAHGYDSYMYEHIATGGQTWTNPYPDLLASQYSSTSQDVSAGDQGQVAADKYTGPDNISAIMPELRAKIFAYLTNNDLTSLCLTSTACRDSAEPFLYRVLKPDAWSKYTYADIVRQMIARPRLAEHVRIAKIGTWSPKPFQPILESDFYPFVNAAIKTGVIATEKSAEQHIKEAAVVPYLLYKDFQTSNFLQLEPEDYLQKLSRTSMPDHAWIQSLYIGFQEPQIVLLLSLCVKLQRLQIGRIPSATLFSDRIFPITHGLHSREGLKTLSTISTNKCIRFFQGSDVTADRNPIQCGSLSIEYVYFRNAMVNPPELENLLLGCKRLRLFSYEAKYPGPDQVGNFALEMRRMLSYHSTSLTCLRLSLHWKSVEEHWKTLKDFEVLQFLEVDQETLTGGGADICWQFRIEKVIPASLQVLSIVKPLPSLNQLLLQILDALDEHFPNLKKVYIQFPFKIEDVPDIKGLEDQFQEKHVDFHAIFMMWDHQEEDDSCPIGEWVVSQLPQVANVFSSTT